MVFYGAVSFAKRKKLPEAMEWNYGVYLQRCWFDGGFGALDQTDQDGDQGRADAANICHCMQGLASDVR